MNAGYEWGGSRWRGLLFRFRNQSNRQLDRIPPAPPPGLGFSQDLRPAPLKPAISRGSATLSGVEDFATRSLLAETARFLWRPLRHTGLGDEREREGAAHRATPCASLDCRRSGRAQTHCLLAPRSGDLIGRSQSCAVQSGRMRPGEDAVDDLRRQEGEPHDPADPRGVDALLAGELGDRRFPVGCPSGRSGQ